MLFTLEATTEGHNMFDLTPAVDTHEARDYTPAEAQAHDAIVAHAYSELTAIEQKIASELINVHVVAGDRRKTDVRRPRGTVAPWTMTDREATEAARMIAGREWDTARGDRAGLAIQGLAIAESKRDEQIEEIDQLEDVRHRNGSWRRFFLVAGGHIHKSRSCHTLRPTTTLGWLPNLSGLDEAAAVAEHGPLLCSHCFPTAPVEWTIGPKPADDVCPGSKTQHFDRATARMGYVSGNAATCSDCAGRITLTSSNRLRTHKLP